MGDAGASTSSVLGLLDWCVLTFLKCPKLEQSPGHLNVNQRVSLDNLCLAVPSRQGRVFFLKKFEGSGKRFLINLVLTKAQSDGGIALANASSGIAATQLVGGSTAHSRFKIPINIGQRPESTRKIRSQKLS